MNKDTSRLPIILIAAVLQGWALYALHHAVSGHHWPAQDPAWLFGLYCVALFAPVTVQLLSEHARNTSMWLVTGAVTLLFFYLGWHEGAAVVDPVNARDLWQEDLDFPIFLALVVLWLLILPFIQCALLLGRWEFPYAALFTHAWRNKISLAEALLFTGLLWLILLLWQMLFHMLGMDFFRDLFREPIFIYPVTALTFGCALHLIGSIDRLVSSVLEQILNVLKWLAPVAITLLTLFTIALTTKLPGLVASGERAIGAVWLLWLIAVIVLLLNAAFRDGTAENPYPGWIARVFRYAVPLTIVVALTALYALIVRSADLGLTVERVWAFIVAGSALLYACGYSLAAFDRKRWFAGVARVNVAVALLLAIAITTALTPILSPYRLAANSQYARVLAGESGQPEDRGDGKSEVDVINASVYANNRSPLHYLRFDAGAYGMKRLRQLAAAQTGKDPAQIRALATAMLEQKTRWNGAPSTADLAKTLAALRVFPAGRAMPPGLADRLQNDWETENGLVSLPGIRGRLVGLYVDLNGDGSDEFVVAGSFGGLLYRQQDGAWSVAADLELSSRPDARGGSPERVWERFLDDLSQARVATQEPQWKELRIGNRSFRAREIEQKPGRAPTE